jgi:hypothetical protein
LHEGLSGAEIAEKSVKTPQLFNEDEVRGRKVQALSKLLGSADLDYGRIRAESSRNGG